MNLFFLILARDERLVNEKISEMKHLNMPYLIVCGARLNHPNVVYRKPRGKFDAINFGAGFVPESVDVVALNDVDTSVHNLEAAIRHFDIENVDLVFAKVSVGGPQRLFYRFLDFIRRRFPITASGELMLIRRDMLFRVLPLNPCKAEDSYLLFKVLEFKGRSVFCENCYVKTERTKSFEKEQDYKRKTVCGVYQALAYAKPSVMIRIFYMFLPIVSPMMLLLGKKGYFWTKGILLGFSDYLRGDRSGAWDQSYMK